MAEPKILKQIEEFLTASDEEVSDQTIPVDADTLAGHPVEYFASKTEVNLAISNYVATVLGRSY